MQSETGMRWRIVTMICYNNKHLTDDREDKMSIGLIKLQPDCSDRKRLEQINNEAFPPSERISVDEMFDLARNTDSDILGIYDQDLFVGFMVLAKNTECGYVFFLAIDHHFRSKGYGSAAIRKLLEVYSELQIILDFEEIDENADNYEQRVRRKRFYLQNGFRETGRYTKIYDDRFEVVCSSLPLRTEAFQELIHVLHRYTPKFVDGLF